ncbi:MAG: hypothetical protein A2452_09345 [Candidatus Firestonebacteria bacterium RIFOXYC2_FULL_39_67]|nr:MAG: hypothetical protein A2536_07225 [Candidatus Firestonebacteria bacterium RIFOXYD2_FULL_39_29]OGF54607.1 MAG: hypothetical protein A2452_09345 [Candidatus Firestonebacteria bacterium RIFOXYC2_FULL_39_67]OGF56514.1 MAG: hypothetical protein A2497_07970 [Candidatus Firestonebacteria bacterium RifOxyC12_full_39_7]
MNYYLFRHGESEANKARCFANYKITPSLTETGKKQAESMHLVMKDLAIERVYVSPYKRARETAAIIFQDRELYIEDNLKEIYVGELDGKSEIDPANWKKYINVVDAWEKGDNSARFEGGESNEEVKARIEKVLARANKECKESAAFVAHSDIFRSFFWLFCENHGKMIQDNYMDKCRVTVVSRETGSSIYRIEAFNATNL